MPEPARGGEIGERVMPGMPFGTAGGVGPRSTDAMRGRMRASAQGRVIAPRSTDRDVHVTADGHTFTMSNSLNDSVMDGQAGWSRRRHHDFDPSDPWAVDEGVPPVLAPGPEPYHDPGPGVIGIDR